jgi:hypothetical protein
VAFPPVGYPLGNQYADSANDDGYTKPTHASAITAEQEQRHDKQKEDCLLTANRRNQIGKFSSCVVFNWDILSQCMEIAFK